MAEVPAGWKLKAKKRSDGKTILVGKDASGSEYTARTCEADGVTERDLQVLSVMNRETSTARNVVKFFEGEKAQYEAQKNYELEQDCLAGAERVVHAGLHLTESRVSFSHISQEKWDRVFGKGRKN